MMFTIHLETRCGCKKRFPWSLPTAAPEPVWRQPLTQDVKPLADEADISPFAPIRKFKLQEWKFPDAYYLEEEVKHD